MTLNLKTDEGRAIFLDLASTADVVIENFRSDVKHRLGIDYEAVSKVNPRIVYGSISGFGQDGPDATRPGVDQIAQGIGGLMSITGEPGRGPMRVGIPICDLTAGLFLFQAVLMALMQREKTGVGQWVHTSLLEAEIFMLDFQAARWLIAGDVPKQAGQRSSDRDPDRRISDLRRPHQHRGVGRHDVGALRRNDRCGRYARNTRTMRPASCARATVRR